MKSIEEIGFIDGGGYGRITDLSVISPNDGFITNVTPRPIIGENKPTQQFDLSVLAGLRPQDKYLGRNRVSDIIESYQTYISGSAIGRGGKYAVDSARKYGTTLTEAARGYLEGVGLPILAELVPTPTPTPTNGGNTTDEIIKRIQEGQEAVKKQVEEIQKNITTNPFKVLADELKELFGNAVYNPPLQSQATGYTPVTTSSPIAGSVGGSSIGLFIVLGVVGVIAYFAYKRFAS